MNNPIEHSDRILTCHGNEIRVGLGLLTGSQLFMFVPVFNSKKSAIRLCVFFSLGIYLFCLEESSEGDGGSVVVSHVYIS